MTLLIGIRIHAIFRNELTYLIPFLFYKQENLIYLINCYYFLTLDTSVNVIYNSSFQIFKEILVRSS